MRSRPTKGYCWLLQPLPAMIQQLVRWWAEGRKWFLSTNGRDLFCSLHPPSPQKRNHACILKHSFLQGLPAAFAYLPTPTHTPTSSSTLLFPSVATSPSLSSSHPHIQTHTLSFPQDRSSSVQTLYSTRGTCLWSWFLLCYGGKAVCKCTTKWTFYNLHFPQYHIILKSINMMKGFTQLSKYCCNI